MQPTVFTDVTPDMTIAREEVFGPVLAVMPYRDEDDALRIANDSPYGLGGFVFGGDRANARRVVNGLRTGRVSYNGAATDSYAPMGGYKQSGIGRSMGRFGLRGVPRSQIRVRVRGRSASIAAPVRLKHHPESVRRPQT